MLEHLLETRLSDVIPDLVDTGTSITWSTASTVSESISNNNSNSGGEPTMTTTDLFLDDFLLTHIVFFPSDELTSELWRQYPFLHLMYQIPIISMSYPIRIS